MTGTAKYLLASLLVATAATHAGEPAPARAPSLNAPSMLPDARLDKPIDTAKNFQLQKGVLELRGTIDAAMRERFESLIGTEPITTVRIKSQGGQIADALRIGAIIESRGIDVTVHDMCLGACAQYIFVAGKTRRLEDESLVGFINSVKSSNRLMTMAAETLEVRYMTPIQMERLEYQEEELYRKRGVAASLLMDPQLSIQPSCIIVRREGRAIGWTTSTNYLMWVPTRDYLRAAGVEFEGDWPKSNFWLGGIANRHLKIRAVIGVRFGDDDPLRKKNQPPYSLEQLRKCVLDEETGAAPPPG